MSFCDFVRAVLELQACQGISTATATGTSISGTRARPPSWAETLPDDLRSRHRFVRPSSKLVCDRASSICYKRGNVDKSPTQDIFGERAGDRADDLRDRLGTARLFVPQRDVACDRNRRVCFDDGVPDRKLSRRYFGREAAQTGEKTRRSRAQKS